MTKTFVRRTVVGAAIFAAQLGCKTEEPPLAKHQPEETLPELIKSNELAAEKRYKEYAPIEGGGRTEAAMERVTAEEVWPEISKYRDWTAHTNAPVHREHPQGDYTRLFYNATAKAAIGGGGDWPDDTIFVMENYATNQAGDGPGEFVAITAMKKGDGVWFWAQYNSDGTLATRPDGSVIAGVAGLSCEKCHTAEGRRDHVISNFSPGA